MNRVQVGAIAAGLGLLCLTALVTTAAADPPRAAITRAPLTTSKVVGYPEPPPPYRAVPVFEKLAFKQPLYMLAEPGSNRLIVVVQGGKAFAFENTPDVAASEVYYEIPDHDTYSLCFHPDYAKNRWVYVFANGKNSQPEKSNRILRYEATEAAPRKIDMATEHVVIEWVSNGHNGGEMAFDKAGLLYISAGDGTSDSDTNVTGQDIRDLVSGVIRIDLTKPENGKNYGIPPDNPFLQIKDARPELWAYGFRNPWRLTIDPATDDVWVGDIGQDLWEMVHVVKRGDNKGWSIHEGSHPFYLERERGPTPISPPTIEHPHSEARSITGGIVYQGSKFPDLRGAYIYGDYSTGKIWGARYADGKVTWHQELADTQYAILGFAQDPAGEIYLVEYGGKLAKLEPMPPSELKPEDFPRKLSQTGLFTSVAGYQVQPALIPYSVNSPLWSDGAYKERHVALPELTQVEFKEEAAWVFPERTVLVKTFSLEEEAGKAETRKRIETRLLLYQQKEWTGYSYLWNAEQTDAELVPIAGTDREYRIRDAAAPGGERTQTWHYPSRAECMVCHSRAAVYVLGLSTAQMNRVHDYGGVRENQLRAWEAAEVFSPNAEEGVGTLLWNLQDYEKLADPYEPEAPLEARVRSYLHANCAHCHVAAGGGNAAMDLHFRTKLPSTAFIGVKPLHHKFQLPDPLLVAPGAPERSVLLHRLTTLKQGRMPPLASSIVDQPAADLLAQWIRSLPPPAEPEKK